MSPAPPDASVTVTPEAQRYAQILDLLELDAVGDPVAAVAELLVRSAVLARIQAERLVMLATFEGGPVAQVLTLTTDVAGPRVEFPVSGWSSDSPGHAVASLIAARGGL